MQSRVGAAAIDLTDTRKLAGSTSRTSRKAGSQRPRERRGWVETLLFVLVLTAALVLRIYKLDQPVLWCDEAESAINGLTILQNGYPADHYLGQPIFENTLTELSPESAEYEFRDSSYSKKGFAIYHGWLPLYAMAASQWAFGIEPATDTSKLTVTQTPAQLARRTIAARLPSAVFGMIFVGLVYVMGREMYGKDAGWAAFLIAALAVPVVNVARQARYYSLTVTLCAACTLFLWRVVKRGHWRDYIGAAICASLLFHTHVLTFMIVCIVGALLLPLIVRQQPAVWGKLLVAAAIVCAAVIPWGLMTGFFSSAAQIPAARATMHFPQDLFIFAMQRWPIALFLVAGTAWMLFVHFFGHRLPAAIATPFQRASWPALFLAGWCIVGWLAFMLLIPAVSLWLHRAYLGMLGAGIVVTSVLIASCARVSTRNLTVPVCCALFLGILAYNFRTHYPWNYETDKTERVSALIDYMRTWPIRPQTRVYCTPGDQHIVAYYSDVPVQSVAPVRRSYLESYPHDVVVLECFNRFVPIGADEVRDAARAHGIELNAVDAESWAKRLTIRGHADYAKTLVAEVKQADEPLPTFANDALRWQREQTVHYAGVIDNPVNENPAVFRGFPMPDYSWWWQVFFYRFVGIEQRTGDHLNYLPRLKNARAVVLPGSYVVYFSPPSANATNLVLGERRLTDVWK